MRLLILIPLLALCGCTPETRSSFERAHPWTVPMEVDPIPGQPLTVVYPDAIPRVDHHGAYKRTHGVHINQYDAEGNLVSHRFQEHKGNLE